MRAKRQPRLQGIKRENFAQFVMTDGDSEAAELRRLEKEALLSRAWDEDGAVWVFLPAKGALFGVGATVLAQHRWGHRRWEPSACCRYCESRVIYLYVLLTLTDHINPKLMPVWRLTVPLIERALNYRIQNHRAFHNQVVRDRGRLLTTLAVPRSQRSPGEKRLLLLYSGIHKFLMVAAGRPHTDDYHATNERSAPR
jgi:hypothetical protein